MRFSALVRVAAVALSVAAPLSAQSASDKATARTLAEQGISLARAGKHAEAIEKLRRAQELYPAHVHLVYLARSQAATGQLVEAAESYHALLRLELGASPTTTSKKALDEGKGELAALEPRIPALTVHVEPAGVAGVELSIDGAAVSSAIIDVARPTNPGRHQLRASAAGYAPAQASADLREGQQENVTLKLEAGAAAAAVPVEASPGKPRKAPTPSDAEPKSKLHRGIMARIGVGGGRLEDSFEPAGLQLLNLNVINGKATGATVSGELTFTGALSQGLLLGGGAFSEQVASPSVTVSGVDQSGTVSVGLLVVFGPYLDWYPGRTGGLHFSGAVGGARITVKDPADQVTSEPAGAGVALGVGYEWRLGDDWAIGAQGRFIGGSLTGNGFHHTVTVPALLLTLAYD